ncbi:histidine phosphatase family protein [Viridibacterium curvum]|uniref:Histidine phosphatase family protein n=1 Tax=Viridibacterium curvum TaxID=1101404 RepID=A0ABP9QTS9_9RHOO
MRSLIKRCVTVCLLLAGHAMAASPEHALREGGVVLMIRHAITEPGTGDPPGFRLDDCSTQRQLSAEGRAQARAIGAWLTRLGVQPTAVFSSAWCRCVDTATLAFPALPVKQLPALNSFFAETDGRELAQTAALREALQRIPAGGVTVWVSHQVNVTALTGEFLAMGEAVVLKPDGQGGVRVLGRIGPHWPA